MIKTPQKLDFFLSNFWGAVQFELDRMRFIMEIFASFSPEIELLLSYFSLLIMTYFSFLPLRKSNKNMN